MFSKVNLSKYDFLKIRANFRKHGGKYDVDGVFGVGAEGHQNRYGNHWDALQEKQLIRDAMEEKKTERGTVFVIRESRDCDGTRASYISEMPLSVAAYKRHVERVYEDAEGPESVYMVTPSEGENYEPYWIGGW